MKHREFPPFIPNDECKCKPAPAPYEPPCCAPCGMTTEEQIMRLNDKVDCMTATYNQVMSECYKTLHNLEEAAEENGAYYGAGEVWTEQGYYADESATYTLTHKAVVDRHGEPIRIGLHLAYDNTTNSKIEQDMFSASKVLYADKILVAQPKTANGWYGNVIYRGAPIATYNDGTLYTVGFTKAGVMRVYQNGIDKEQMLRDTIENAMGCSGVLILNGQLTDDSYRANIPNATEQVARVVIGQNSDTREVIFLTCGNENNVNRKGMTSKACAQILLQYGCDIAVELCEADNAGAMNKGQFMFVPDNNEVPTAYCYWYISRRCFYKNDYTREVAELMQNYGQVIWENFLTGGKLDDTIAKLNKEIADRIAADNELQENINAEADTRAENDTVLQENINAEITRATAAEKTLQTNIDNEKKRAQAAEQNLEDTKVNRAGDTMTGSLQFPLNATVNIGTNVRLDRYGVNVKDQVMQLVAYQGIKLYGEKRSAITITNLADGKTPDDAVNKRQLDAEVARATNAEDTEKKRAQAAEQQLQANIDAEVHARENADTALHNDIVTEQGERMAEDADLLTAINKEKEDRTAADGTLQANINTEKSERTAADNATNSRIDGIVAGTTDIPYLSTQRGGSVQGAIVVTNGENGFIGIDANGKSNNAPEINSTGTSMTISVANGDIIVKNEAEADGKGIVTNLKAPKRNTDAANKQYIDEKIAAVSELYVAKDSAEMQEVNSGIIFNDGIVVGGNIDFGEASTESASIQYDPTTGIIIRTPPANATISASGSRITDIGEPVDNNDAATKAYVDAHSGGGGAGDVTAAGNNTFTGTNTFTGKTIVATPTEDNEAATKAYVDAHSGGGGNGDVTTAGNNTFTGTNTFNGKTIVATPTEDNNAATKKYVDDADNEIRQFVNDKADTKADLFKDNVFSRTNKFDGKVIITVTPTVDNDAANKKYVDSKITGGGNTFTSIEILKNNNTPVGQFTNGIVVIYGDISSSDSIAVASVNAIKQYLTNAGQIGDKIQAINESGTTLDSFLEDMTNNHTKGIYLITGLAQP